MGANVEAAAEALVHARRTRKWLTALPGGSPGDSAEAYAIQDRVALVLGAVGGWKVGAESIDSEPFRGPIQANRMFMNANRVPAAMLHVIGVEAELAYEFARDLPNRDTPYTRDEMMDAIGAIYPVIEILDTRFTSIAAADPLSRRADHQSNGALAVGPALKNWRDIDPTKQPVRLMLNGTVRHEGIGGNLALDNLRLLAWLANRGTRSHGGLRAGQIVTTGSCTGTDWVDAGTRARAEFPGIGAVEIEIA